jgi:DNA-binding winged helix-turn-helix (wHTH) protein/tetratricopeptide (TPR) repeat protein
MHTSAIANSVVRFGLFEADLCSGELRRNGVKIKIQELPFRALKLLLSRPNQVLSREELRNALWPDGVFVDFDHGISSAINRLRDALGDSADNPVFIETVERRGYRWIAPTHAPAPPTPAIQSMQTVLKPGVENVIAKPPAPPAPWKWLLALPAFALAFVAWTFWPTHHAAKAGTTLPPAASLPHSGSFHRPINPEAEQLYLKGRFYWNKRTPDSLNQAVDYFTQAIVHDPNYAQAYVGLADCYNLLREYTRMPASEAYPRALAAATRAVELDDRSSEAHASLAFVSFYGMWDAATADREFRRALDLDPNNAVAHHWYATYLMTLQRFPESLAEIERAQALDPASASVLADKGDLLFAAGHPEEAIALLKQVEHTEPTFLSPHRYLRQIDFSTGDYPGYFSESKKVALTLHDGVALAINTAAEKGFASGGVQGMLLSMEAVEKKYYSQGQFSPYALAQTCALLGDREEALRYLKIAYARHDESVIIMDTDLALNALHTDPAYRELASRVGVHTQN